MALAAVQDFIGTGDFVTYKIALAVTGIVLLALGGLGLSAGLGARILSAVIGAVFVLYAIYLQFLLQPGVVPIYRAVFIFAFLVLGYFFYSRAINREDAAEARADPPRADDHDRPPA